MNRIFGLDLLRAFAILTVIYGHGSSIIEKHINMQIYNRFIFDGVTIFFVLSGFLIGGILLKIIKTKNFTFKALLDFWRRRWFRTLPNYFLVLLCLILIDFFFLHKGLPNNRFQYFFFLQNFRTTTPGFFGESWSLSVEEWFYLTIPFLMLICLNLFRYSNKERLLLFLSIGIILVITILRYYKANILNNSNETLWFSVITRLDSIMYGVLGAFLKFYKYPIWEKYNKLFLFTGLIFLILFNTYLSNILITGINFPINFYLPAYSIATLMLLPFLSEYRCSSSLSVKIVTQISILSYSMYLIHNSLLRKKILPIIFKNVDFSSNSSLTNCLITYFLYVSLTILLSYILYNLFEKKMTDLREKFGNK